MAIETKPNGQKIVFEIGSACRSLDISKYKIVNPFSHPRMLLGDFQVAEKLIQYGIREIHKTSFFTPAPRVIFQPMEKTEGGLSEVENRAFIELCFGAGAREVLIYMGDEAFLDNIDFNELKQKQLMNSDH